MSDESPPPILRVEVSSRKAEQVRTARRIMLAGYPYLGALASSDAVPMHGVRTNLFRWCATDGVGVYFNDTPDGFFEEPGDVPIAPGMQAPTFPGSDRKPMNTHERVFGFAHELIHHIREDVLWKRTFHQQGFVPVPRSPAAPEGKLPFDDDTFEKACDAQINDALRADRVGTPPEGAHFDPRISWRMTFGEAYALTYDAGGGNGRGPDPRHPIGPPPPGKPCNQGKGDVLQPGQAGDPNSPSTDPNDPATQPINPGRATEELAKGRAEREMIHKRAQSIARQMGVGSSCIEQMVDALRVSSIDWRDYIHGFLSRAGGASAWDWTRPARPPLLRKDPFFSPSRSGYGVGTIVIWMDTSGSMQVREQRTALGVVADVLSMMRPKRLVIGFCDSAVQRVDGGGHGVPHSNGEDSVSLDESDFGNYNIPQGGGTDFHPPFRWMAEHMSGEDAPDAMIYFTDLEGCAPIEAPPYPVLWCNINPRRERPLSGGEWGEVIPVPIAELN